MGALYGEEIRIDDPFFGPLTDDRQILAEALYMRLTTARGTFYNDSEYGLAVTNYVNEGLTADAIARIPAEVQDELGKDPRVAAVEVTPTITGKLSSLKIKLDIRITPVEGDDFTLILAADASAVEFLALGGA